MLFHTFQEEIFCLVIWVNAGKRNVNQRWKFINVITEKNVNLSIRTSTYKTKTPAECSKIVRIISNVSKVKSLMLRGTPPPPNIEVNGQNFN